MVKVVKFGGSSLADAKQFVKVANIIKADKSRKYVIPSAPGKRFPEDIKVTDMLYDCYSKASSGKNIDKEIEQIKERYNQIINELGLDLNLDQEFERIKIAFMSKAGKDYAASRGEYLNGMVLAKYLGFPFIDAAEIIFFNDDGTFNSERTNDALKACIPHYEYAVIPGFYGSMPNDTIKTFSRGGSDITGALVARGVDADLYENWTDVSGFLVADPRIVNNPRTIDIITYRELRELSYMGATVLHEEAIFPVRISGIPINIKNTNAPDDAGTLIVAEIDQDQATQNPITGIAGKKGFSVITLEKDMMNQELGFVKKVLDVLEKHKISFEHLPSGIDTLSIVVSTADIQEKTDMVISAIKQEVSPDSIQFDSGLALLAIVGRNMVSTKGTAAKVFYALAKSNINIRMIDQGSSELNIIVGINELDFATAIKAIYNEFNN